MKASYLFPIILVFCCFAIDSAAQVATAPLNKTASKSDSIEAVKIVEQFFKDFDERKLQDLERLLPSTMTIIHSDGAITSVSEMIKIIQEAKTWPPRTRKLSVFDFTAYANTLILGVTNEVTFTLRDGKKVSERSNETWIFQKTDKALRPIWNHYSKVTVDRHSEE